MVRLSAAGAIEKEDDAVTAAHPPRQNILERGEEVPHVILYAS